MAKQLNIIGDVEIDGTTFGRVQIVVRKDVATVSRQGTTLAEKAGVLAVPQPGTREWHIEFADSSVWVATKPVTSGRRGCGSCG